MIVGEFDAKTPNGLPAAGYGGKNSGAHTIASPPQRQNSVKADGRSDLRVSARLGHRPWRVGVAGGAQGRRDLENQRGKPPVRARPSLVPLARPWRYYQAMAYVLIVDDDLDGREMLCKYLRKVGHEAECVPNGREALASILSRGPDLIILDMCMPELDGADFLKALRSYLGMRSVPIVVLTGVPDSPLVDRARFHQVSCVLVKGTATPQDVLHAVEEQLSDLR